jgi:uncharacterized protein (TIGR00369 family)
MRKINPDYVRAISEETNRCPYFTLLSMRIVALEIGGSHLELTVQEKHLQPFAVVHGGVFASIIDAAAFWAVYSEVEEDAGMTTVDLKLNYLAPAASGKLIAHGRRIKLGRTLGLGEAEITDVDGRLLAHGTSTLMVIPVMPFRSSAPLPRKFIEEGSDG